MTTITKIEPQFKPDGKPSGFKVTLADGTLGYLVEKDSDKDLKDGESVNYTAETPAGKSYKKLTIHRANSAGSSAPAGSEKLPQQTPKPASLKIQYKVDAAIKSMEFAMDTYAREKQGFEWDNVINAQRACTQTLWSQIDEIFSQG